MEINAGNGRKGRLVLREHEQPSTVAASFARIWGLPPATESRLTRAIELQLHKQGLVDYQGAVAGHAFDG